MPGRLGRMPSIDPHSFLYTLLLGTILRDIFCNKDMAMKRNDTGTRTRTIRFYIPLRTRCFMVCFDRRSRFITRAVLQKIHADHLIGLPLPNTWNYKDYEKRRRKSKC